MTMMIILMIYFFHLGYNLNLTVTPWRYHYPHKTHQELEAQRGQATCLRLPSPQEHWAHCGLYTASWSIKEILGTVEFVNSKLIARVMSFFEIVKKVAPHTLVWITGSGVGTISSILGKLCVPRGQSRPYLLSERMGGASLEFDGSLIKSQSQSEPEWGWQL